MRDARFCRVASFQEYVYRSWSIGESGMAIQPSVLAAAMSASPGWTVRPCHAARAVIAAMTDGIEDVVRAPDGLLVGQAVEPWRLGQETIDEVIKRIGHGRSLVAGVIQAPAAQRGSRIDLNHMARPGPVHRAARGVKLRQQDRAAQGHVRDPVRRDAQWHEARLLPDDDVRTAHREFAAPARTVIRNADMARAVGGHEIDECGRPAERAVDPSLVGLLNCLEYGLVPGRTGNISDGRAACSPFNTGQCRPFRHRSEVHHW